MSRCRRLLRCTVTADDQCEFLCHIGVSTVPRNRTLRFAKKAWARYARVLYFTHCHHQLVVAWRMSEDVRSFGVENIPIIPLFGSYPKTDGHTSAQSTTVRTVVRVGAFIFAMLSASPKAIGSVMTSPRWKFSSRPYCFQMPPSLGAAYGESKTKDITDQEPSAFSSLVFFVPEQLSVVFHLSMLDRYLQNSLIHRVTLSQQSLNIWLFSLCLVYY